MTILVRFIIKIRIRILVSVNIMKVKSLIPPAVKYGPVLDPDPYYNHEGDLGPNQMSDLHPGFHEREIKFLYSGCSPGTSRYQILIRTKLNQDPDTF